MLKLALALARKDLSLALRGAGLVQSILLGLLLVFMFSLSQKTGRSFARRWFSTCSLPSRSKMGQGPAFCSHQHP